MYGRLALFSYVCIYNVLFATVVFTRCINHFGMLWGVKEKVEMFE